MSLLFHLACSGGTLISRCLASMKDVCLLSEINPGGSDRFNPLRQAAGWYGLVDDDEIRDLEFGDVRAFSAAMGLIRQRASERGLALVIRDWSHLDWIGFPFAQPSMMSAWDAVQMPIECDGNFVGRPGDCKLIVSSQTGAIKTPVDAFLNVRCATVRHPVDQYLRTKRLGTLESEWDDAAVWRGMCEFAKFVQAITWIRYEDFLHCPASSLQTICGALEVRYDDGWEHRWQDYHKITGDATRERRLTIAPKPRVAVDRKCKRSICPWWEIVALASEDWSRFEGMLALAHSVRFDASRDGPDANPANAIGHQRSRSPSPVCWAYSR